MANLKIIWTTGSPFSPGCIDKIAYETSPGEWNVYKGSSWNSQSSSTGRGYRPATAEEIAEHWKVLHPKWTPEPGDKVIITQEHYDWRNQKGVIVEKHDEKDYWRVQKEDGKSTIFSKSTHMILAPYEESVKSVEATESIDPIKSMHGFTIGDVVIPISDNLKGRQCIVKVLSSSSVGVHCPSGVGLGHTLDGHCPNNTGWWYHPSSLELVSKEKEPEEPVDLTEIMPGVGSFKVGDKVLAHSRHFDGCTGTIVRIHPDGQPPLGVQFEKYHSCGHTLDGNCPMGYGWYYDKDDLTLVVGDKSLSKPSTPSTPSVPIPKEGYVTLRFLTEEEFKAKGLWNSKGYPEGWNNDGEMNKYLGTYIQLSKSKFDGSSSFRYEDWHFAANNYEVIHDSVETKPEPKPETTSKPGMITVRFFTETEFKAKGNWDTPATCPKGWVQAMNKYLGQTVNINKSNTKIDGELCYNGWTFTADDYEVLTLGYESKASPKVEPEMKKQRFKVGDRITYKSRDEFDGVYCHGGTDQGGYVGRIESYGPYNPTKQCYNITVSTKEGGSYNMLESEFREYDSIHPGAFTLGSIASGTSAESTPYILFSGSGNTALDTTGLQIHQTIPKPKDDLSHYNQLPVLIHKKPTKRLVVVDAY